MINDQMSEFQYEISRIVSRAKGAQGRNQAVFDICITDENFYNKVLPVVSKIGEQLDTIKGFRGYLRIGAPLGNIVPRLKGGEKCLLAELCSHSSDQVFYLYCAVKGADLKCTGRIRVECYTVGLEWPGSIRDFIPEERGDNTYPLPNITNMVCAVVTEIITAFPELFITK